MSMWNETPDRGRVTAGWIGRRSMAVLCAVLAGTAVLACDDDNDDLTGPTSLEPIASIEIEPASVQIELEETALLTATPRSADGTPLDREVTWSSTDELIATVSAAGVVVGVAEGETGVRATAEGVEAEAVITVAGTVATVTIVPGAFQVTEGDRLQLAAEARDANGHLLERSFDWESSDESVATVDATGMLTGLSEGSVTISAWFGEHEGSAEGAVWRRVVRVAIETPSEEPLDVGLTRQLSATGYDVDGAVVPSASFIWESSHEDYASVDEDGLVTGVRAIPTVNISASVRTGASAAVELRVRPAGDDDAHGNNLSWPLVFAEGIGLSGAPVASDPGTRPLPTEADAYAELAAIPVTNPTAEFLYSGNELIWPGVYLQKTANTWRAQLVDGTGQSPYDAAAGWGGDLTGPVVRIESLIRVEMALSVNDGMSLIGYNTFSVFFPHFQGTDGETLSQVPLIYTVGPTLTIEQLDGMGGSVVATVMTGPVRAGVDATGRVIYRAQFRPSVPGWYRLRFALDEAANVRLTGTNAGTFDDAAATVEVQVTG